MKVIAEVRGEFAFILEGVSEEVRATESATLREYLLPANRYRLFLAITIQIHQQLTGNTSLAYYAPQIFKEVEAGTSSLLATGFLGIIKVVLMGIFIVFAPTHIPVQVSWTADQLQTYLNFCV